MFFCWCPHRLQLFRTVLQHFFATLSSRNAPQTSKLHQSFTSAWGRVDKDWILGGFLWDYLKKVSCNFPCLLGKVGGHISSRRRAPNLCGSSSFVRSTRHRESINYSVWLPARVLNALGILTYSDVTLNEPEGCVMTRRARYVMSQRSVFAQRTCLFWWRKLIYSCSLLRGRKPVTSMYIFKGLWWVCVCVGVCLWMIRHCALPTPVFFFCYSGCLLTLCLCCPPTASNNPSSLSQTPGEACVSVICHWVMNGCTFMGIGSF